MNDNYFEYNDRWNLFPCKCGYKTNKSRKALRHIQQEHKLSLLDGDNHIKMIGKFHCICGKRFSSEFISVIYQNGMLRKFRFNCLECGVPCLPIFFCSGRIISDDTVGLMCRWKKTMKLIKGFSGRYHKLTDHKRELCEACQMGICDNGGMVNYDPNNMLSIKVFNEKKHQVASISQKFEVLTIADSVVSGATSLQEWQWLTITKEGEKFSRHLSQSKTILSRFEKYNKFKVKNFSNSKVIVRHLRDCFKLKKYDRTDLIQHIKTRKGQYFLNAVSEFNYIMCYKRKYNFEEDKGFFYNDEYRTS